MGFIRRATKPLLLCCVAGCLVILGPNGVRADAAEPPTKNVAAATARRVSRVIISTSKNRAWTYVSISPGQKQVPLAAGFVIQYATAAKRPINFAGFATVEASRAALRVRPQNSEGWVFVLSGHHRPAPDGVAVITGVAGIIRFDTQSLTAVVRPLTHDDFVARAAPLILKTIKGGLYRCRCGGVGSIGCTLNEVVSGSCGQGYFVCCNDGACGCIAAARHRSADGRTAG